MDRKELRSIERIWTRDIARTHFVGCWRNHYSCTIRRLIDTIRQIKGWHDGESAETIWGPIPIGEWDRKED